MNFPITKLKMDRNCNYIIITLTLILVTTILPVSLKSLPNEEQVNEDLKTKQRETKFNVPFLILLSPTDLSIAQLPLIDNGSISIVYELSANRELELAEDETSELDGSNTVTSVEKRKVVAVDTQTSSSSPADAREYEQMPSETNRSLGKSEWQQIASNGANSNRFISGSAGSAAAAAATPEEVGVDRRGKEEANGQEAQERGGDAEKTSRPRRSNSAVASINHEDEPGNGSNYTGDVPESSSLALNVTSARSSLMVQQYRPEEREAPPAEETANDHDDGEPKEDHADVDGEANDPQQITNCYESICSSNSKRLNRGSGPVQFSDFDVHMALGYAFVADTRGRIHRFGLSGFENNKDGNSNINPAESDDYTNAIDAADERTTSAASTLLGDKKFYREPARDDGSESDRSNGSGASSPNTDVDANRVSGSAVTHEQSSRHPTVSGLVDTHGSGVHNNDDGTGSGSTTTSDGSDALVEATNNRLKGESFQTLQRDSALKSGRHGRNDDLLIVSNVLNSMPPHCSQLLETQSSALLHWKPQNSQSTDGNFHDAGSRPRVIWSRSKHPPGAGSDDARVGKLHISRGAYPSRTRQSSMEAVMPDGFGKSTKSDSEQMESAESDDELERRRLQQSLAVASTQTTVNGTDSNAVGGNLKETAETREPLNHRGSHSKGKGGGRRHQVKTEIAVDWLNNLLFVLDKYRLIVMDFNGNNELVLIDDFNASNRPFDIKVDPINDFLFWLQIGRFHNTIYKLDLKVLSAQYNGGASSNTPTKLRHGELKGNEGVNNNIRGNHAVEGESVALTSHHYAHPVITNLPKHAKLFTIDLKHSRIYVPLAQRSEIYHNFNSEQNKSRREEAEVFAPAGEFSSITHMNNTDYPREDEVDCNSTDPLLASSQNSQVLAYNLDGTDVGPVRTVGENSHLSSLDDMQDLALDSDKSYFYWLTNNGKELFEEYKGAQDSSYYSAQHSLDGKIYIRLMHFGSNQLTNQRPRLNLRRLFHMLAESNAYNRQTRSDEYDQDSSFYGYKGARKSASTENDLTRFSPVVILSITALIVVCIYLVYALVFQQMNRTNGHPDHRNEGSISESSMNESHIDCDAGTTNGFLGSSTISRWIGKPSSSRSGDVSTTYNDQSGAMERSRLESTNYDNSNAIDQHYKDVACHHGFFNLDYSGLTNLMEWPSNMHDVSNKLYVPVELLQDEALASIRRVTIDQLDIERRAPLGEGHFGLVLQGQISCTALEKDSMLGKTRTRAVNTDPHSPTSSTAQGRRMPIPSSVSSGHGSSSTSSEFVTANSLAADSSHNDYLTPKSQCNSSMSDYLADQTTSSQPDSCSIEVVVNQNNAEVNSKTKVNDTKLQVAIKKLKDNASPDEKRDFFQEAKLLASFDHPNIVHLIGICLDRGSTLIVMELMLGGDLIRYMQENMPSLDYENNLVDDDLLKICLDIVNGCCYLEELNYIHRDLAARNCLVSSRKRSERVVKLADFGLARDIYKDSYYKMLNDSAMMPLRWMAPECLLEQKFTMMSDVWSFGIVMWEVMSYCQEKPYSNVEPFFLKEHLSGGGRLRKPDGCSDDVYRLMNECWQLEPNKRPTFKECRATLIEIAGNRRV